MIKPTLNYVWWTHSCMYNLGWITEGYIHMYVHTSFHNTYVYMHRDVPVHTLTWHSFIITHGIALIQGYPLMGPWLAEEWGIHTELMRCLCVAPVWLVHSSWVTHGQSMSSPWMNCKQLLIEAACSHHIVIRHDCNVFNARDIQCTDIQLSMIIRRKVRPVSIKTKTQPDRGWEKGSNHLSSWDTTETSTHCGRGVACST